MNRRHVVFLDRDGTINREVDVLHDVKQLRLLPGAAGAVAALNRLGYLTVIATNQAVIARGWRTEEEVNDIHRELVRRVAKHGGHFDAIHLCPHHPNANLKRYRKNCQCRKPGIGMIRTAAKLLGIRLDRKSYFVGDHTRDILAGKRAGLTTILVETGYAGKDKHHDVQPDFVARNLAAAVKIIKKHGT